VNVAELAREMAPATDSGRPTAALPMSALIRISAFWLGLTSIDAVVNAAIQTRLKYDDLVVAGTEGRSLALIAAAQFLFAIAVQPTAGAISDYVVSRWGRRKPFIVFGASLDALFLIGIASREFDVAIPIRNRASSDAPNTMNGLRRPQRDTT